MHQLTVRPRVSRGRRTRSVALIVALMTAVSVSAACSNPRGTQSGPTTGPSAVSANAVADARQRLTRVLKGTFQTPDTTPRPAVRGKKVVFLAAGLASTTSSIPLQAAQEAGKLLGWDVSVL